MNTKLEVLLSPAEFACLRQRDISASTCVVFDVLRATTSMVTALANGAEGIIPVGEIAEAVELKRQRPEVLLAGERDGVRIRANQSGGIDFDFGNSPREFSALKVSGKTIVMTTTNGTRALRACSGARLVLVSSFLNLRATYQLLMEQRPAHLLLVCAGTFEEAALEDTLAAGAVCEKVWSVYSSGQISDSAEIARRIYPLMQFDLVAGLKQARNGKRLLANPELRGDVAFCAQRETFSFAVEMRTDGTVVRKRT